mmetsp:Transcript_116063/g.339346  ORF Transcript_116063/g.339346 Transcript_116063/m.339346 type:complete len:212 (-) Transcript_116063:145-780(-)
MQAARNTSLLLPRASYRQFLGVGNNENSFQEVYLLVLCRLARQGTHSPQRQNGVVERPHNAFSRAAKVVDPVWHTAHAQAHREDAAEVRAVAGDAVISTPLPFRSKRKFFNGSFALALGKVRKSQLHGASVVMRGVCSGLQRVHSRAYLPEAVGVLPIPNLNGHVEEATVHQWQRSLVEGLDAPGVGQVIYVEQDHPGIVLGLLVLGCGCR